MAAPANNFSGPQAAFNPFGPAPQSSNTAPGSNPFGAPSPTTNPFGQPSSVPGSFGAPANNPFLNSSTPSVNPFGTESTPPFAPNAPTPVLSSTNSPFGAAPAKSGAFGTPSPRPKPFDVPLQTQQAPSLFSLPASQPFQTNPFGANNTSPFGTSAAPGPTTLFDPKPPFGSSPVANGSQNVRSSVTSNLAPPWGASSGPESVAGFGKKASVTKNGFGDQVQQNGNSSQSGPFKRGRRKSPTEQQSNGFAAPQSGQKRNDARRELKRPHVPSRWVGKSTPTRQPTERTKQLSQFAYNYATSLYDRLQKDHIKAPQWPSDLGNPDKRGAVEGLKETYKKYRVRVYESLRKAEIIDDPEKRRRLADALPFKGICEDMCPEFERISRIAEHDVKTEEKEAGPDGYTMWANPAKMVKKFGRSAAGQDAPLPQDVRSVDALRRTTDYLFNDLLQSDNNLPSMHNFLWDRTRAVRRDFTFHSQKSAEEMKDLVYCFETITRFHATALHLLSRKGFAQEDFDFKQEIEQLGRTILSLMEAYDACREKRVHCENEAEFRAYYLLLNVHDPSIGQRIPTWGKEYWFDSEEIQTAMSLVQAMEDVREPKGPIRPKRGTTLSDAAFTTYFSIVEDPKVSYTMACIAEIHFTTVRQNILRNLVKGYARYRDAPRTISAPDLNKLLRFDTPEEAIEFSAAHNFEFSTEYPQGKTAPPAPYLLLNDRKKIVPSPRIAQSFSGQLVERKRGSQSLPHVIYNTIYEQANEKPKEPRSQDDGPDSLFIPQSGQSEESGPGLNSQLLVASDEVNSAPSIQKPLPNPPVGAFGSASFAKPAQAPNPFSTPSSFAPSVPSTQSAPLATTTPSEASTTQSSIAAPVPAAPKPASVFDPASPAPSLASVVDVPSPFSSLGKHAATSKDPALFKPLQGQPPPLPAAAPVSVDPTTKPVPPSPATPQGNVLPRVGVLGSTTQTTSTAGSAPARPSPLSKKISPSPTPDEPGTPTLPSGVPSILVSKPTTFTAGIPSPGLGHKSDPSRRAALTAGASASATFSLASTPVTPAVQSSQGLKPLPQPGPSAFPSLPQPSPSPGPGPTPPAPPRDPMANFTKWFVLGDYGLMEQFTEFTVQEIVTKVFQKFQEEEEEKKRKAEDDASWNEARKFRAYSLGVRYFYKWQENARARATQRILARGKEKMRLYREQERMAKAKLKDEAIKVGRQARREAERRIEADGQQLSFLASTARMRRSGAEEQLLASGIFSGLRDERAAARRAIQGADSNSYAESDLVVESRRQSISTQTYEATPDSSISRREGWKTRSLREKFGLDHRRSMSAGSSVNGTSKLRQSLPALKKTNFSRKRSADDSSDEETGTKRKPNNKINGFRTKHWDLRARGFIPTPDGQWAPEQPAGATQTVKCFDGLGDDGQNPEKGNAAYLPDYIPDTTVNGGSPTSLQLRLERLRRPTALGDQARIYRSRSRSASYVPSPPLPPGMRDVSPGKRKRQAEEEDWEQGSSPSATKKSYISREESQAMVASVQNMVRELKQAMDKLDEDRVFFREQSGVLRDGSMGY